MSSSQACLSLPLPNRVFHLEFSFSLGGFSLDDLAMDDSNQPVEDDEEDEEKSAHKLIKISNGLLDGIEMEEDLPSRYEDKKLPILDMKC